MTRKTLKFSEDLSLPLDMAATQTYAFLARKGAGKTYAAGKLVELLLEAGVQCVVLDAVGNWGYGLRLGADGKSKGFDIPVLGGLRGDVPLEETGGDLVANTLVDTGSSAVLDISQFSLEARRRFATGFAVRLWARKKAQSDPSPLFLVIEECQLIIPQNVRGDTARMVGIYEEIIRLGRNYGIGVAMISQRPQSVNKDVLNQTECLVVLQTNGKHERDALKAWVLTQGADVDLVKELPTLPVGTAYVWSPQWLQVFKKVRIGKKETFDASATPKVGERRRSKDLEPLDLGALKAAMAETIARAEQDDPRKLRKRIVELERELKKPAVATATQTTVKEVPALSAKDRVAIERVATVLESVAEKALTNSGEMALHAKTARGLVDQLQAVLKPLQVPTPLAIGRATHHQPRSYPARASSNGHGAGGAAVGQGGVRRILTALAQRPEGLTNRQIGVRAGLSSKSGTFSTYLGKCRAQGWIEDRGDKRFITDAGIAALGSYELLPTGQALLEYWLAELGQGGLARILRSLADAYPRELSNEEIGELAQIAAGSGTFSTYMGKLRALELVEGSRGATRASSELFD